MVGYGGIELDNTDRGSKISRVDIHKNIDQIEHRTGAQERIVVGDDYGGLVRCAPQTGGLGGHFSSNSCCVVHKDDALVVVGNLGAEEHCGGL